MKHAVFGLLLTASSALAQPLPVLQYDPPKDFSDSVRHDPSAHVALHGDAILNVYQFRRFDGPFAEQFRRTLLREVLARDRQEARIVGTPEINSVPLPGAETLYALFIEDRLGVARHRLRFAIFSAGAVALVDYDANGAETFQRNWQAVGAVLDSLKISAPPAASAEPKAPAQAGTMGGVDGLFMAGTQRFIFTIGGPLGSGSWQFAMRFYLLSPDGRFHRGYGLPSVPGGDIRRFDYAAAEREDPHNTGTYTVQGGRLLLRTRAGETAEGKVAGDEIAIENLKLKKSALK